MTNNKLILVLVQVAALILSLSTRAAQCFVALQQPRSAPLLSSVSSSSSRRQQSVIAPTTAFLRPQQVHHAQQQQPLTVLLLAETSTPGGGAGGDAKNASEISHEQIADYRQHIKSAISGKGEDDKQNKELDVVMKFGGSSLANADRIDHVAKLIQNQRDVEGYRPRAVVCSAMGKTTNSLLSAGDFALEGRVCVDAIRTLHNAVLNKFDLNEHTRTEVTELLTECEDMLNGVRLIQELSPKSLDQLVSYGERCSVRILAARLNQIGVPAQAFDAWDVGILTDSNFGDAKLLKPDTEQAIQAAFDRLDPDIVAVVTGFIGHDPKGRITTLGRGGSDLTATAVGSALDLDEIQVWKDVDGILSSDPRLVPNAMPIADVSYEEASELAYFGAQVLHPIAMQPARQRNVPVRVKNSYNPSAVGTMIRNEKATDRLVTAITYKRDVKLMDLTSTQMLGAYGFLARVFGEFEKHKLSVDVLASSEVSVSLTLDKKQNGKEIDGLVRDLGECACVTVHEKKSILTLIADVERSSEVLATVFKVFASNNISVKMMSQGASKVNISFIVDSQDLDRAILELHKCFFEDVCSVEKYHKPASASASGDQSQSSNQENKVNGANQPLIVQP